MIHEENGNEKGSGIHDGFFDSVYASFGAGFRLPVEGDWIQVSLDYEIFPGTYPGGSITNDSGGLRISLVNGAATNDAGLGLYIGTGSLSSHTYREMRLPASSQATIANALTGQDLPEDNGWVQLRFRLRRVGNGIELSGDLDGHPLTVHTNLNAIISNRRFDTLGISVASRDHGLRIDNVQIEAPTRWAQFVSARGGATEPDLPDFSYAGLPSRKRSRSDRELAGFRCNLLWRDPG